MNKNTIEDYLLSLGKLAVHIQLLSDEQRHFTRSGVLENDEMELAETIKYICDRLVIAMGDQVRMVGERTPKTWGETIAEINKLLTEKGA